MIHGLLHMISSGPEEGGWIFQFEIAAADFPFSLRPQTIGLRTGLDAELATIAILQIQDHWNHPRAWVDMIPLGDAILGAGIDAPQTALAIFSL